MKINAMILCLAATGLLACNSESEKPKQQDTKTVFLDPIHMDTTVNPADNFFQYANGNWLKNTEMPASKSSWGAFYALREENQEKLHQILLALSKEPQATGFAAQKVADLFTSGMDSTSIEALGYEPIKPALNAIDAIKNHKELVAYLAAGYQDGAGELFAHWVGPDAKNSSQNKVQFYQSGLGLPDRDYYLKQDAPSKKIREAYRTYIIELLTLTGETQSKASKDADAIIKLETEIARSHKTRVELRDPIKNYHVFTLSQLQKLAPNIAWKDALERMLLKTDVVLVGQPAYYTALSKLLVSTPIDVWKQKIKFSFINDRATALSSAFDQASFDFYGKVLQGKQVQEPRFKRLVSVVNSGLGDLLGQLFVKEHFKPAAKARMIELVNNLETAYKERIQNLDWMSQATKAKALEKLASITKKIGYPDTWKTYEGVQIDAKNYYANQQAIQRHAYQEEIEKLGKKVDKTQWHMTAPTVNAYYSPSFNEIVFPAGILQFPFFDQDADDAINYGAIGAVIGHEITHGFDDQGRRYDGSGNLKDWWTKADAAAFTKKANVVVKQFDQLTVLDSLHVNGQLTLGENLADLGGLSIAYDAFMLTDQAQQEETTDGFTPAQRFFLSYAQVWRSKKRDEAQRLQVQTDPHAPEMHRVNGPLSNLPEFYEAFDVKEGDGMYLPVEKRAKVW